MVGLTEKQRSLFGDKLLDPANLVAAALVFGQFVAQQPVSMGGLVTGIAVWLLLASMAYRLTGGRR
jgi:hypothetical protein